MIDAPLGFALAAGMVAAFNPCGFAMLPAYLSVFLGLESRGDKDRSLTSVGRALGVATAVSAGFVVAFGLVGIILARVSLSVVAWIPWLTVAVGLALIPLGVAMAAGFEPSFRIPRPVRGPAGRGLGSMFGYGVSYAVVSLSCTLPVFLAVVSGTFTRTSFAAGAAMFGAYALGMTLVLFAVTLAIAAARNWVVVALRRALPYIGRTSGLLLAVAGAYVAFYGYWELRLGAGSAVPAGPVAIVGDWSARIETLVDGVGSGRLAAALLALILAAILGSIVKTRLATRR